MDETHASPESLVESPGKQHRPAQPVFEFVLCVIGSLGTIVLPGVSTALMVFGAWLLARKEEGRAFWAIVGCLGPGIALSFATWDYASLVLPCALAALAIALLLPGRVSVTSVVCLIAVLTALLIGADASLLMLQGENFAAYVQALLEELRQVMTASLPTGTSSVSVSATVDSTVELLGRTWPLIYVMRAISIVLLGSLGLVVARRDSYQKVSGAFKHFDVPLWLVAVFIVSLAVLAGWVMAVGVPEGVGVVALNIILCLRLVFFLQGFAVMLSLMDSHGWGAVPRVLVISAALLIEMSLSVVCVLGLVDVWANFRKLARTGRSGRHSCGEGE